MKVDIALRRYQLNNNPEFWVVVHHKMAGEVEDKSCCHNSLFSYMLHQVSS